MPRTPEEDATWGPRLSDRELVNAKNGTAYGPDTPLIHGVQGWERNYADFVTGWLIQQGFADWTGDEDAEMERIWLAAIHRAAEWVTAQEEATNAP